MNKSVSECLEEVVQAAKRVRDEAVRLKSLPKHDGTVMVLVPESLFKRLEAAVAALEATGEY